MHCIHIFTYGFAHPCEKKIQRLEPKKLCAQLILKLTLASTISSKTVRANKLLERNCVKRYFFFILALSEPSTVLIQISEVRSYETKKTSKAQFVGKKNIVWQLPFP